MKKISKNKRAVFGDLVIGASMEKNVKWKMVRSAAVSAPVILCNPSTSRLTTKRYSPILYITYGIFFPVRVEAQGSLCECTHLGEVVWGGEMDGALFPSPQFMS